MWKDLLLFTVFTVRNYDITQLYTDVSEHSESGRARMTLLRPNQIGYDPLVS